MIYSFILIANPSRFKVLNLKKDVIILALKGRLKRAKFNLTTITNLNFVSNFKA